MASLRAAGCVFAEEEAAILMEAANDDRRLGALLARRVAGEPLEQIVGWVAFVGRRLSVAPGVFVPRQRTALLAEVTVRALRDLPRSPPAPRLLEAFCGVGPVASTVIEALPEVDVHLGDADPRALTCALTNVERSRATAHTLDCLIGLPESLRGGFDVISAVPPYVPDSAVDFLPREALDHEPPAALFGGADGLDLVRRLIAESADWLSAQGRLLIEVGRDQGAAVEESARARALSVESHLGEDELTVVVEACTVREDDSLSSRRR